MKSSLRIASAVVGLALAYGCGSAHGGKGDQANQGTQASDASGVGGTMSFAAPPVDLGQNAPSAQLHVTLTRPDFTRTEVANYQAGALEVIGSLPAGAYHVAISLTGKDATALYAGETDVTIVAGQVAVAQVTLTQKVDPETDGGLTLDVKAVTSWLDACDLAAAARGQAPAQQTPAQQQSPAQQQQQQQQQQQAQQKQGEALLAPHADRGSQDQDQQVGGNGTFCAVVLKGNVQLGWPALDEKTARLNLLDALCYKGLSLTQQHVDHIKCVEIVDFGTLKPIGEN